MHACLVMNVRWWTHVSQPQRFQPVSSLPTSMGRVPFYLTFVFLSHLRTTAKGGQGEFGASDEFGITQWWSLTSAG